MDISSTNNTKKVRLQVYYEYKEAGAKKTHVVYLYLTDTAKQT